MASLKKWWEDRTGAGKLLNLLLLEHIPGGVKWRYVWGSTLVIVFFIQLITGLMLMLAYSPGASTSWASVYFIQYQMDFGWLIRGLHHYGSQAMVVLLSLHMIQVVIAGAHLPPREINWWLGLGLMGLVLGEGLTGYLLPWDQKGYWATQVATNIVGSLPGAGGFVRKIIVGGPEYGHHTLTRFYALHVGFFPLLIILLLTFHVAVFRRHGVTAPSYAEKVEGGWFWPDQAFRDLVVALLVFAIMLTLVLVGHGQKMASLEDKGLYERWAHAGQRGLGAALDAPADPAQPYPARPEWFFLFLFQFLKYFEGEQEIIGTLVIPHGVMLLLIILPLLGYGAMRRVGHAFGVLVMTTLVIGVLALTSLALGDDMEDPVGRWIVLRIGLVLIPTAGVVLLLQLSILAFLGVGPFRKVVNIVGGTILALLLGGSGYLLYGAMGGYLPGFTSRGYALAEEQARARMTAADKTIPETTKKFNQERRKADQAAVRAMHLASAGIPAKGADSLLRRDPMTRGAELFGEKCASCHTFGDRYQSKEATASDLKGFGTEEWILGLLRNPAGKKHFGRCDPPRTTMSEWVETWLPNVHLPPEERDKLPEKEKKEAEKNLKDLTKLAQWLARSPRPDSPDRDTKEFKEAIGLFNTIGDGSGCRNCHVYAGEGGKQGPDLTGYGNAEWLRLMIMAPYDPSRYGNKNTMPIFRDLEGKAGKINRHEVERTKQLLLDMAEPADPDNEREKRRAERDKKEIEKAYGTLIHLSPLERELVIRWILGDDRVVFGGEAISAPPKAEEGSGP
jgi:quinol-cytochrome oxidoreductase complex cytochrome b subunit/mono/diheme cytochrome c family protein